MRKVIELQMKLGEIGIKDIYTLANSVTPLCANSFPHSIITHRNISGLPIAVNFAEWRKL